MRGGWFYCAALAAAALAGGLPAPLGHLQPMASASASEGVIIWRPGYSFIAAHDIPLFTPFVAGCPYVPAPVVGFVAPAPLPVAVPVPLPVVAPPVGFGLPIANVPNFNVPNVNPPARQVAAMPDADAARAWPKPRETSPQWKARAGKFIGYGDVQFGKQQYSAAASRYKSAIATAPDLPESYFRQGFALVALGRYESAVNAFRRGLRIKADWSDSPFRLDQIYGDQQIAKTAHLESLAKAVEDNPFDAALLVALGMQMYFDGQPERAEPFFVRAAQLGGNEDRLLDRFLPRPRPDGAPRADGAPADGKIVF